MKINQSINLGTVCHTAATLLLAQENLSACSEMMFPAKNNRYRETRLNEIARLAWDLCESVEHEGTKRLDPTKEI